MGKAVLILGGAGFIGSALARRLAGDGRPVQILSRRPRPPLPRGVAYFRGSLDDRAVVKRALRGTGWVVHVAAESVPATPLGPVAEAMASVLPTLRFLEWLPQLSEARLLFVSTGGAIYGNVPARHARERAVLAPLSYYAAGKASLEAFLSAYSHLNQRSTAVVRPSNVYGPGQPVRAGFGVVPSLLSAAASGRPFEVLGSGAIVRDYLYVDDLVELCCRLFECPVWPGVVRLNAGSGRGHSVEQLIRLVESVTNRSIRRLPRPGRRGDVRRIVLNSDEAFNLTGWRASVPLREGLIRSWQWYSESPR